MDIKKLFINCIIVLFVGVVVLSVVTVVKRGNAPEDVYVPSDQNQSVVGGDTSVDIPSTEVVDATETT